MSAAYRDLREFIQQLESVGELRRVTEAVSPHLEMTAVCDRVLRQMGPALLFENPTHHTMPVLGNLFGTTQRVAQAMGMSGLQDLRALGQTLAALKAPVDAFFDGVMVNAEDAALRANRQALLNQLYGLMNRVADLSRLSA